MAIKLYWHNEDAYTKLEESLKTNKKAAIVQPTGTGKSFIILKWLEEHSEEKTILLSPSAEIFNQLKGYAADEEMELKNNILFLTYQKLNTMTKEEIELLDCSVIILDEFHRAGATEWGRSIEQLFFINHNATIIGFSATPVRYLDDARNMADELFDGCIACERTYGWCLANGILESPKYIAAQYDIDGQISDIEAALEEMEPGKERNQKEKLLETVKKQLQNSYGIKDIFTKNMPTKNGKYIVFCRNVSHIYEIQHSMNNWLSDVNTQIHSYISIAERSDKDEELRKFIKDSDEDAVKLLYSVDRFNEGLHVKGIDGVIMLRPTISPIIYLQQMGRAMHVRKPDDVKTQETVIFDLVNNFRNATVYYDNEKINVLEHEIRQTGKGQLAEAEELCATLFGAAKSFAQIVNILSFFEIRDYKQIFIQNVEVLKDFKQTFGRFPTIYEVHSHPVTGTIYNIGDWCNHQRQNYKNGKLSDERIQLLLDIGFEFGNLNDTTFMKHFEALKDFVQIYGRFPLQGETHRHPETGNVYNVGIWCNTLKRSYKSGKLTNDKIQLLLGIGFEFGNLNDATFMQNFEAVKDFAQIYGRFPVTNETHPHPVTGEVYNIGSWCIRQRQLYKKGKLSDERIQLLLDIGFEIESLKEAAFMKTFETLMDFIQVYGRFPVYGETHKHPVTREVYNIGTWCSYQRTQHRKGKLTDDKIKLLKSIDFKF